MSTGAIAFGLYFGIGLLLLVLVIATRAKEKGLAGFEVGGGGDAIDAWLLIFIAILWPVWIIVWLMKEPKPRPNPRATAYESTHNNANPVDTAQRG